jgi:hypothetical protein
LGSYYLYSAVVEKIFHLYEISPHYWALLIIDVPGGFAAWNAVQTSSST